jgi:hypothetical protein
MTYYHSIHQGALDFVSFDKIIIVDVLGEGRNGACFKVKWNGMECAMKQFDIGRDGNTYSLKTKSVRICCYKRLGVSLFLDRSFFQNRIRVTECCWAYN